MSEILLLNVPLMVLFLALWAGIPLYFVLRRRDWHHKPEARMIPAYLAAPRTARPRRATVRVPRTAGYEGHRSMRPLSGGANG